MIPYDDIAGYLRQELSADRRREVESWVDRAPENRRLFERLREEWELIGDDPAHWARPDREKIWQAIWAHVRPPARYTRRSVVRIACTWAAVACVIGAVGAFFVKSRLDRAFMARSATTVEAPPGRKAHLTLPDGTAVWLNSDSRLRYAAGFNAVNRLVELDGEAFFRVTKNRRKPFIVRTSGVDVTARGTSFDVSAYADDPNTSVSLLEGSVWVSGRDGTRIADLHPNELAVIPRGTLRCTLYREDAEIYRAWVHDQLDFHNADIFQIVRKLERWYGVGITLVGADPQRRYTFRVKTESLREILDLFGKLTPIECAVDGKNVSVTFK